MSGSAIIGANGLQYARGLDISVDKIGWSTRARNIIGASDAKTVADLSRMSRSYFVLHPNCGKKTLQEIVDVLHSYGVGLCA